MIENSQWIIYESRKSSSLYISIFLIDHKYFFREKYLIENSRIIDNLRIQNPKISISKLILTLFYSILIYPIIILFISNLKYISGRSFSSLPSSVWRDGLFFFFFGTLLALVSRRKGIKKKMAQSISRYEKWLPAASSRLGGSRCRILKAYIFRSHYLAYLSRRLPRDSILLRPSPLLQHTRIHLHKGLERRTSRGRIRTSSYHPRPSPSLPHPLSSTSPIAIVEFSGKIPGCLGRMKEKLRFSIRGKEG